MLAMNSWGGISPLTPDYINPEKPWPHLEQLRLRTESKGFQLRQRLPVYPGVLAQAQLAARTCWQKNFKPPATTTV